MCLFSVAAAVGRLVPQLTTLSLSDSYLLHMPKTALLLTSPSIQHGKVHRTSSYRTFFIIKVSWVQLLIFVIAFIGENYKLKAVKSSLCSLDLRNVDDENCEIEIINQPQGLQHIHFMPFLFSEVPIHIEPSSTWATAAKHLSSLIHAHKDTLKSASIILPSKDVLTALGECKLEVRTHKIITVYHYIFLHVYCYSEITQQNKNNSLDITLVEKHHIR